MARAGSSSRRVVLLAAGVALALVVALGWLVRGERSTSPAGRSGAQAAREASAAAALEQSEPDAAGTARRSAPAARGAVDPELVARPPAATPPDPEAVLAVHVRSTADGAPVDGARVHVLALPPGAYAAVAAGDADARGTVEVGVPAGRLLEVLGGAGLDWHGGRAQVDALAPGERRELALSLAPVVERVFVGRVVRGEDGTPIEGARVVPSLSRTWRAIPPEELLPATSDGEGYFTVRHESRRHAVLRVEAPGRSPRFVAVDAGHPTRADAREIALDLACELSLRVVDERRGPRGRLSARLEVARAEPGTLDRAPATRVAVLADLETDGVEVDGVLAFPDPPTGVPLEVTLRGPGWILLHRQRVVLAAGERRELVAHLPRGCRVVGRLVDGDGAPVSRAVVRVARFDDPRPCAAWSGDHPAQVVSPDGHGWFAFDEVPAGRWLLGVVDTTGEVASAVREVEVPAGASEVRADLVVHGGLALEGRVVDARGEPAAARRVHARASDGGCGFDAVTDEEGRFRIAPVPLDAFTLTACDAGGRSCSDEVPARPGEPVVLRLSAGGGLLVAARDAATGAPVRADVHVARPGRAASHLATTDAQPPVIVDGLRPGPYGVVARAANGDLGVAADVVVQLGHRLPVDVPLRPPARLEVRCGRDRPVLVRVLHSGVRVAEGTCGPDHALRVSVPAGELIVRALESPSTPLLERAVTVEPGGAAVVDLDG